MNSSTTNIIDMDEDLRFVPLPLEEPFKSKMQNYNPLPNSISNPITNDFGVGVNLNLPHMNINDGNLYRDQSTLEHPLVIPPVLQNPFDYNPIYNSIENDINYNAFLNSDTLYCYNSDVKDFWENTPESYPLPTDILKNFDFSLDLEELDNPRTTSSENIDRIFKCIENNTSSVLGTLKAYRVPYPIASLIIKRIIKLTLTYNSKVGD